MNDSFWYSPQKFMDHDRFMLFWDAVKGLLYHMATERIHTQAQGIPFDSIGDCNDLVGSSMFEAALDEKVPEAVYHERIGLVYNCLYDFILLLSCPNLELLL